jgi:hypothetical protein
MQVYCRIEVMVDDPDAVTELAVQDLREADIDWQSETDTLDGAVAEMRGDLPQALSSVVRPERMLDEVPGVDIRGGRWWVEFGAASERFQPGFE